MARVLRRAPYTVSREVARNVAQSRPYRACTAQVVAATRATTTAHTLGPLAVAVCQTQLTQGCSPEQIAGRLRRAHPDDMNTPLD